MPLRTLFCLCALPLVSGALGSLQAQSLNQDDLFSLTQLRLPPAPASLPNVLEQYPYLSLTVFVVLGLLLVGLAMLYSNYVLKRRAEAELVQANRNLEEKMHQRQQELEETNERLRLELADRKAAEKALFANEIKLRSFLEFMPAGICVIDSEGRIEFVNSQFCELFNLDREQAMGQAPERLFATLPQALSLPAESRESWIQEDCRSLSDGRVLTLLSQTNLVPGEKEGSRRITFVIDITERKEMENQLRRAHEEAKAAVIAKEEFLAMVSHEIRTPLNSILGITDLLLHTEHEGDRTEQLEVIHHSGENLLAILNDILDYSKIEAEKLVLEKEPLELGNMIEECFGLFAQKAKAKGILLLHQLDRDVPHYIRTDATRIRQIVINLVGNAVKFTNQGSVLLTVNNLGIDEGGIARLRFSVTDTGIGIPQDGLDKLFEAFNQIDSSTSRKYGGTGLGLAICKKLVQLLGGQIQVKSRLGEGSTFEFTIPTEIAQGPQFPHHNAFNPLLQGKQVLLLMQHPLVIRCLMQLLKGWGLRPLHFTEKELSGSGWKTHEFSLILQYLPPEDEAFAPLAGELVKAPPLAGLPLVHLGQKPLSLPPGMGHIPFPLKRAALYLSLLETFSGSLGKSMESPAVMIDPKFAQSHPLDILLVDDNSLNLHLMRKMLHAFGYRAEFVDSGRAALLAASKRNFDVIFMDIQMPEMDGIAATSRLRGMESVTAKIIALTARAMKGDRENFLALGFDDYLAKPVLPDHLRRVLEAWHDHLKLGKPLKLDESAQAESNPNSETPLFDLEVLTARAELGASFFFTYLNQFEVETPHLVQEMEALMRRGNWDEAEGKAHFLAGQCFNFGCLRLGRICRRLEESLRQGEITTAQALMQLVAPLLQETNQGLRSFAQRFSPQPDV